MKTSLILKSNVIIFKILLSFSLLNSLYSCHFYTELSYRQNKKSEYIREEGYMLKIERAYLKGPVLIIGTYTPKTWDEGFYYGYLNGIKSDSVVTITGVNIQFANSSDTLILREVRDERTYVYTSPDLEKILKENKTLKITVSLMDSASNTQRSVEYHLKRHKHSYPTGTFPHTL